MPSTILKPIAQSLTDLGDALVLSDGVTVKGYLWERVDFDHMPAAVVEPPDGSRGSLGDGETQLGSDDWFLDYQVSLYVDLDEAVKAQEQMVEMLEGFVSAVDDDPSLGSPLVMDTKVTRWEKFTRLNDQRPLAGYELTVQVERIVDPNL